MDNFFGNIIIYTVMNFDRTPRMPSKNAAYELPSEVHTVPTVHAKKSSYQQFQDYSVKQMREWFREQVIGDDSSSE